MPNPQRLGLVITREAIEAACNAFNKEAGKTGHGRVWPMAIEKEIIAALKAANRLEPIQRNHYCCAMIPIENGWWEITCSCGSMFGLRPEDGIAAEQQLANGFWEHANAKRT